MDVHNRGRLKLRIEAEELRRWTDMLRENPAAFDTPDEETMAAAIEACGVASEEATGAVQRLADSRELPAYRAEIHDLLQRVERRARPRP